MLRILTLFLALVAGPVLSQGLPTSKPPPLGATAQAPSPAPQQGGSGPSAASCPAPLANGCLTQQSSCQMACPPMWSMNPNAPAFTPTDRAGCMQQCFQRYLACRRLYGC